MKISTLTCIFWVIVSSSLFANNSDQQCEKALSIFSDIDPGTLKQIYEFKRENHDQWLKKDKLGKIHYTLEPKETITYKFSWTVYDKLDWHFAANSGSVSCEVPVAWQLTLTPKIKIIYPSVMHGHLEEVPLHDTSTLAGIYLGKSKFTPIIPDITRIIWHIDQEEIPSDTSDTVDKIKASHNFIADNLSVLNFNLLDKNKDPQLIALQLSNQSEINKGNQQWLVTTGDVARHISEGYFASTDSRQDKWLPWYDPSRVEFNSTSPLDAYKKTVLAHIDLSRIYDRSLGSFLREPWSIKDNAQVIHDALADPVYEYLTKSSRLFARLIIKQAFSYKVITFEILKDGSFDMLSEFSLQDPVQMGLPSAFDLGYGEN